LISIYKLCGHEGIKVFNFISGRFDEVALEPFVGVGPIYFAELLISNHGLNNLAPHPHPHCSL